MEFKFNCEETLNTNHEGIAVLEADKLGRFGGYVKDRSRTPA